MTRLAGARPRAIADVASGSLHAVVEIETTPERLFAALTSREVVEWWGQEGVYRTTAFRADLRVGGSWRSDGVGADGAPFFVEGEYLAVEAPRRVSFTWRPSWHPGHATTVHYRLDPIDGGTRLTLRHEGFTSDVICEGHAQGWARIFGWLAAHAGARAANAPAYFLIRLLPPRPTFMQTMTSAERDVMRDHVGYWTQLLGEGAAVAFGPVADPSGGWGVSVVEVEHPNEVNGLIANDPAKRSGLGFQYEVLPMLRAIVRPR
ncbi:MAG TPA: SRPBCC domain-containing protein [Myxococcota bacterium]|jgi:uncharacterized protein YndB with AHSA1/START domain